MHIHIATVGTTTSIISDVITGVGGMDRIYLLTSNDAQNFAQAVKSEFPRMDVRIIITDQYDFMKIINLIYEIKKDVENEFDNDDRILRNIRYSVNITGGRKIMASALAVASIYLRADIYYKKEQLEGMSIDDSIIKVDKLSLFDDSKFSNKNKEKMSLIIRYLNRRERDGLMTCAADIKAEFDFKPQTISKQISNLIAEELIQKQVRYKADGSEDNRSYYVKLTPTGAMFAKRLPLYKYKIDTNQNQTRNATTHDQKHTTNNN